MGLFGGENVTDFTDLGVRDEIDMVSVRDSAGVGLGEVMSTRDDFRESNLGIKFRLGELAGAIAGALVLVCVGETSLGVALRPVALRKKLETPAVTEGLARAAGDNGGGRRGDASE